MWSLLADALLFLHLLFVGFVVLGLALIVLGGLCAWRWVRNPWLRCLHLAAIGIVAAEAWLGMTCPLTTWENAARARGGQEAYAGTFMSHWMQAILYYDAPAWVFTMAYTGFFLLVAGSWVLVRPRWGPAARDDASVTDQ